MKLYKQVDVAKIIIILIIAMLTCFFTGLTGLTESGDMLDVTPIAEYNISTLV